MLLDYTEIKLERTPYYIANSSMFLYFFFKKYIYFLLVFSLPTYRITPSAHPIKCPLSVRHPVTHTSCPHPLLPPLVRFPELGVSHVLSPFLIFPTHFFSFPLYSLSLFFIFPKWMRPYNVCPSPIDLFHSASYPPGPSTLKHMVGICRFHWLRNIPPYTETTASF